MLFEQCYWTNNENIGCTLIENNYLTDNGWNNHNESCNLEKNKNNGWSNKNIINTSRNHYSGSNYQTTNINKCANCFRQNHSDQHLR